jgi:hypothetical protein
MKTPPHAPIDNALDAYNALDSIRFASYFCEDATVYEHPGKIMLHNRAEIQLHYKKIFNEYPLNQAEVLNRIILGARVVDHERIIRHPEESPIDVVVLYELREMLIERMDIIY